MAGYFTNKRFCFRVMTIAFFVILMIYIPAAILLAARIRKADSSDAETPKFNLHKLSSPIEKHSVNSTIIADPNQLHLQLHNIELDPDGSVDLTLNLNVNELVNLVKAYTLGNFNGESTRNKLPPKINFLLSNGDICTKAPNVQYLIYVHTAPSHESRRELLRNTWGDPELYANGRTRIIFLLGRPDQSSQMDKLLGEQERYKDLVIGDFKDEYHNLTLKAIMGLKWVTTYCPKIRYVIKSDDDAFVNIFEIMKVLEKEKSEMSIVCPLWTENTMPIMRDPTRCRKWCVHFYEFPGRSHFPQYCAGLTSMMSGPVVKEMYEQSHKTPMFWIDDVFLTGILAKKVSGVKFTSLMDNFQVKADVAHQHYTQDLTKPIKFYFSQVEKEQMFMEMWNATLARLTPGEVRQLGRKVLDAYPDLKKKLL